MGARKAGGGAVALPWKMEMLKNVSVLEKNC